MRAVVAQVLLICCFFSNVATAETLFANNSATGWLTSFNHPPVSVQMQLTGQHSPLTNSVEAVLQVRLADQWKTYWRSPGEGGAAPSLDFSLSTNIDDVTWQWPAPKRYPVLGVETLGYKGVVNFPLTLHLKDITKPTQLSAKLTLASCTNFCVLSDYSIQLAFQVDELKLNKDAAFLYQQALGSVPIKLTRQQIESKKTNSTIIAYHTNWDKQRQELFVQVDNKTGWVAPDLFIDVAENRLSTISFSAPKITISGERLIAKIVASSWGREVNLADQLLNITIIDKDLSVELSSLPSDKTVIESSSIVSMLIFAFIGGLILNIMPCVLPVLGMKLSTVLSAHGLKRKQIRKQFIASSLGILSSFWLLAVFLLLLKLSGQALGWGVQFQSPYFIAVMAVITALFATNMLGIFEIQLPSALQTSVASQGGNSYLGHYLQGMFATLLATPCSAPFLGTAVAFALGASTLQLFVIFTALGLGMALPWLLIALFPVVALCLPKPGRWMNRVKATFAFMMLVTSYWLLNLLSTFIGEPVVAVIACLLTLLLLLFFAKKGEKKLFRITTLVALLSLAILTYWKIDNRNVNTGLEWQPLNTEMIKQQVAKGDVVFVDITADWCVTCKANKIGVLLQEPIYSLLQTDNIKTMRGDWTTPSAQVTTYLQSYDRFAVPFNIVYGPGAPEGIPLPTLLTTETVLSAFDQAKGL